MNQMFVAIVIGVVAAAGTVFLVDALRTEPVVGTGGTVDLGPVEQRLDRIEARLGSDAAGLSTQALPPELAARFARIESQLAAIAELRGGSDAGAAADAGSGKGPLARIEDRLASIEESLSGEGSSRRTKVRPRAKRRVSLAEAADELELSAQEQDELRQIYDDYQTKMFKLAAGKDGNPEDVRREVMEAKEDPTKVMGLVTKYMPKVIGNLGGFMTAEQERQQAIQRVLGPEKSKRLDREFDVKEANPLGIGGGFQTEMSIAGGR